MVTMKEAVLRGKDKNKKARERKIVTIKQAVEVADTILSAQKVLEYAQSEADDKNLLIGLTLNTKTRAAIKRFQQQKDYVVGGYCDTMISFVSLVVSRWDGYVNSPKNYWGASNRMVNLTAIIMTPAILMSFKEYILDQEKYDRLVEDNKSFASPVTLTETKNIKVTKL